MPKGDFLVIPQVSSERRRYIPIGYMDDSVLCSDKVRIMPNISLYHFGILTSNVHMAWMRAICCRLKSDYSYTVNNVYNAFPWCEPTPEQKDKIEKTAQAILDARALYPDSSLADLYDETVMPPELRKAHQANDKAVMAAYGFPPKMPESEIVAELMKMYQKLTEAEGVAVAASFSFSSKSRGKVFNSQTRCGKSEKEKKCKKRPLYFYRYASAIV